MQTPLDTSPPVFVMNTYYSGLGIARNLRGRGVEVYGLSFDDSAPGVRSRFFKGIYPVPNGRDEPEALLHRLLEIRKRHTDAPVLFATRDFDVLFLHRYRDELSPHYRIPQNSAASVLLDKMELSRLARAHGIDTPLTVSCSSIEDLESGMAALRFPLVVKPRFAYQWRARGAWQTVGSRKAFLVEDADQLRAECRLLSSISSEILVQEYISGEDTDIVVCAGYVNDRHELVAYFTARKLRQNPPLFGTGCAVEAIDLPEIVPITKRLLQVCRYSGLAEVEYKHDRSTGRFSLIEVNPRHWDQHELGTLAGVNLSWVAYRNMVGGNGAAEAPSYGTRTNRWIAEPEMLRLLLRNARTGLERCAASTPSARLACWLAALRASLAEVFFLLRGRKIFATFRLSDPLPGVILSARTVREIGRFVARRLSRRVSGDASRFQCL
jgi:predicted ATP-grasp superfamily ATP-dependent carboligase